MPPRHQVEFRAARRALRRLLPPALCLLLAACGEKPPAPSSAEPAAGILRISQRNDPADLDPQTASMPDEFFVIRSLSEGLVVPSPDGGAPLPGIAERWNVSADGTVYTFHLRAARWSNGDPVTAHDFIWSYRRLLSPKLAAPKAPLFFAVKNAKSFLRGSVTDFASVGFAAPDDRTLVVTLAQPMPGFLAVAASGPWIPVHPATLERFDGGERRGTGWTRPGNFVGNGPFTLAEWRPNQQIVVRRNPGYWDAAHVLLAELRFVAFDSGDTEERAFRAGQVDVTLAVPFSKLSTYAAAQPPVLRRMPQYETRYLALNVAHPPLADVRVRRALALAIDRTAIVERVLQGGQRPALSFVPPGLGGYEPGSPLAGDLAEARALLAAAGFPEGRGFPHLELATWVASPVLEAVQAMWRQGLGIEVSVVQREAKVHVAALQQGDYSLAFLPVLPDYADASAVFDELVTGATGNYPRWSNPSYDRLVATAGRTADATRRTALYREAEALLLTDLPVIPIYFNNRNYLVQPRVKGWVEDRLWNRFYRDVRLGE